jgi:hypothetical protein
MRGQENLRPKEEAPLETGGESLPSRYRPANRQSFTRFRKFLRARMISSGKYPERRCDTKGGWGVDPQWRELKRAKGWGRVNCFVLAHGPSFHTFRMKSKQPLAPATQTTGCKPRDARQKPSDQCVPKPELGNEESRA